MPTESTAVLLRRARSGDRIAHDHLARAYLPVLRRIAHGRLPAYARGALDTDDLVQITLTQALAQLHRFEPRHEGAFLGYLQQILRNRIRDEIRRVRARPLRVELKDEIASTELSPFEAAAGRELAARYEAALERLQPEQRQAVVLRLEMGFSFQEIAEAVEAPSPDAARMTVARALVKLAEALRDEATATRPRQAPPA